MRRNQYGQPKQNKRQKKMAEIAAADRLAAKSNLPTSAPVYVVPEWERQKKVDPNSQSSRDLLAELIHKQGIDRRTDRYQRDVHRFGD